MSRCAVATARHVRSRLVAAGYQQGGRVTDIRLRPKPAATFAVRDVDFASTHTFSVAVYVFRSGAAASRFTAAAKRRLTADPFLARHPALLDDYELRDVAAHVYFGFTSMDPQLCAPFGLCATSAVYGPFPTCDPSGACSGGGRSRCRTATSTTSSQPGADRATRPSSCVRA